VSAAKRLRPLLDRVLVEKVVPPTVSAGGILLPETTTKVPPSLASAICPSSAISPMTIEIVTAIELILFGFDVQLNSGTVIEVGPGVKNKEGNVVPLDVKKGDLVLLPEYGGSHVKLEGRE